MTSTRPDHEHDWSRGPVVGGITVDSYRITCNLTLDSGYLLEFPITEPSSQLDRNEHP